MMKNIFIIIAVLLIWIVQIGLTADTDPKPPVKKISKTVNKIWKTTDFQMITLGDIRCGGNGYWYKIVSGEKELGLLYNGRVNSCRAGGCSVDNEGKVSLAFEFFDYLLFTDNSGKVLRVKVYNYQATHGQEVMSRGWLNQFKGLITGEKLEFGRDIETISGATVSATAMTDDIQRVLGCLPD